MRPTQAELLSILRLEGGRLYWISPSKFHSDLVGKEAGNAIPNQGGKHYWHVQIGGRKYKRSHLVLVLTTGAWPPEQVDHVNGDSLDDRPENLRPASVTQNAWNHKSRRKKSPLPMGVRMARSGKFVARIAVRGEKMTLGTFGSIQQAEAVYLAARRQHFGEWA